MEVDGLEYNVDQIRLPYQRELLTHLERTSLEINEVLQFIDDAKYTAL